MDTSKIIARILVYYREIPAVLDIYVKSDGHIIFSKDGLYPILNHSCPRCSLTIEDVGDKQKNDKRINKLVAILTELSNNNQIISFQVKNNLL